LVQVHKKLCLCAARSKASRLLCLEVKTCFS
jgi:hypothetical protein